MTPEALGALSAAERQVWDAFPEGTRVDFGTQRRATVRGELLRSLLLGAQPPRPGHLPRLDIVGAQIVGKVDLVHVEAQHVISLLGCRFAEPPDLSFARLQSIDVEDSAFPGFEAYSSVILGSLSFIGCKITGPVILYGTAISGDLDFDNAILENGDRPEALFANSISVGRHLYLHNTRITGDVDLTGAAIGGSVHADGAMHLTGRLGLVSARVAGLVDMTGVTLNNPDGTAFAGWGLHARELSLRPAAVNGMVDLRYGEFVVLRDDPDRWPKRLRLDGVAYLALRPWRDAVARLAWLAGDVDGYRPQPYEHLAAMYRRIGHDNDARTVLLGKLRRRRSQQPLPARMWGYLQDSLVGYGYRPARAAIWLLALTVTGTSVFTAHAPHPASASVTVQFNPFVYTLDLLLPILNFGQENAFASTGAWQWFAYVLTAIGWILFSAVAAALTRTFSRS